MIFMPSEQREVIVGSGQIEEWLKSEVTLLYEGGG